MSLRSIPLKHEYRAGKDNILSDFFHPVLKEAREYWRAVGYFSSSALEAFGRPLADFISSGGNIRLVTSVELSEADAQAISDGHRRREIVGKRIDAILDKELFGEVPDGVLALTRLIEAGRLEIKIALPKSGRGIYHEKVGVVIDDSDYLAFAGSSNESRTAFEDNYECIDVYPSWEERERAIAKRRHFEELWEDHASGVDVFTFPEAALQKLIRIVREAKQPEDNKVRTLGEGKPDKWRHQTEALNRFLDVERGVLNMATGTGKTRSALRIAETLFATEQIGTMIVATEGTDLLEQWYKELLKRSNNLSGNIRTFRQFGQHREGMSFWLAPHQSVLLVSRYFLPEALGRLPAEVAARTLLVHDEVHGLGSPALRRNLAGLSDPIRFRLGLSATPEREYDEEGNDFIERHVGPVFYEFSLEDAIRRGILAPFEYHPLTYVPTESDRERIAAVYRKQAARKHSGRPMSKEEVWIEISRVYKTSEAKLPIFDAFIDRHPELLERSIIFAETTEFGRSVLDTVHRHRPDFHTYFSGDDASVLRRFAQGEIECLIACHRLSEGIDIQSLRSVILLSSARARLETIQRIGRCLRIDPSDPYKIASVVDFIREAGPGGEDTADEERRNWLLALSKVRPEEFNES